ncbi:MAG: P-loop NTPase [Spirochaetia bacterium]
MQILPIASGKGGVGKSLVAANLAIALSQAGKRVVLADLDLGGSNIHLILGTPTQTKGVGVFINNPKTQFEEILIPTGYPNLTFVPGDAEIPGMANVKTTQKRKLIRNLLSVDADYLIMDLGAGTSYNIMDFFLTASSGIIVTTPTLTATLNAYLFLKNAVFRIMYSSFAKKSRAFQILEQLRKQGTAFQKLYIPRFIERIEKEDPQSYQSFQESIKHFNPRLIMNMLEDPKDADKAGKLRRSSREYLGIDLEHLGIVYRDNLQDIALSSRLPIIVYKPQSVLSQAIYRIADKVLQLHPEYKGPIDYDTLDESYQIAEMEAETDFNSKMNYVEDLLNTGALTTGDLIDTIKSQQFEINQLKKQNNLYKYKLLKAADQGFSV